MAYTSPTADDIRSIIQTDSDDTVLDAQVASAEALYAAVLAAANLPDASHFEIVRFLAADGIYMRDPESRLASLSVDDIRESYGGRETRLDKVSPFWRRAAAFDPTGTIAALAANQPKAEFRVLG